MENISLEKPLHVMNNLYTQRHQITLPWSDAFTIKDTRQAGFPSQPKNTRCTKADSLFLLLPI